MNSDVVNLQNATTLGTQSPKGGSQAMGKEEFLRLLMTQLQAQDPLNPMDSTQFVTQLSQFSSLEQLQNLGSKMDSLIQISGASNAANAVSLLGKSVRVDGDKLGGPATAHYELDQAAVSVQLEVRDEAGHVVKTVSGLSGTTGQKDVVLDGFPNGKYTFRIEAKDAAGKSVSAKLSSTQEVQGINFSGNVPILITKSGQQIPASSIVEIFQSTTPSSTNPPPSGDGSNAEEPPFPVEPGSPTNNGAGS